VVGAELLVILPMNGLSSLEVALSSVDNPRRKQPGKKHKRGRGSPVPGKTRTLAVGGSGIERLMNIGDNSDDDCDTLPTWTSDSYCKRQGSSCLQFRVGLAHEHCLLFEPSDFVLDSSGITALTGTNGAGKTSLARALVRLPGFPQDGFTVEYVSTDDLGTAIGTSLDEPLVRSGVDCKLYDNYTPIEYLRGAVEKKLQGIHELMDELQSGDVSPEDNIEAVAEQLAELSEQEDAIVESSEREMKRSLSALGCDQHTGKTLAQLSSGYRYKWRVLATLLLQPNLLIIDEPCFLDAVSTEWFVQATKKLTSSSTIVLAISHKEAPLDKLVDRILYINSEKSHAHNV
jgi:ATPase subunit of ABC transporter with duplicated ATPase domains